MDYETSAAALFDGGWRASDKEQLMTEHDLTDEEAENICEHLLKWEVRKRETDL